MKTYLQIKDNHTTIHNEIINNNQTFWAFSDDRFEEQKKELNITDNKDLVSIGSGGFVPKRNADKLIKELENESTRYKKELQDNKDQIKNKAILYELKNHECFYTGEIDDVVDALDGLFTFDEIKEVYNKNY